MTKPDLYGILTALQHPEDDPEFKRMSSTEKLVASKIGELARLAKDELDSKDLLIKQLTDKVRDYVRLLDKEYGTLCEQARHEQEIAELKEEVARYIRS